MRSGYRERCSQGYMRSGYPQGDKDKSEGVPKGIFRSCLTGHFDISFRNPLPKGIL